MYQDYSCCRDKVNRAAGQRAVVMVFAEPLRQFYRDGTNPPHLSGLSRQDSSIWTEKLSSVYRDFAKTHANPDTDGNFPYHRAVSIHAKTNFETTHLYRDKYVMMEKARMLTVKCKFSIDNEDSIYFVTLNMHKF